MSTAKRLTILVDLETTGLYRPPRCCLIEIGAAAVFGDEVVDTFSALVWPPPPIRDGAAKGTEPAWGKLTAPHAWAAYKVHRIHPDQVKAEGAAPEVVSERFQAWSDGLETRHRPSDVVWGAHNSSFEARFLCPTPPVGWGWGPPGLCTQRLAKAVWPGRSAKLQELCDALDVPLPTGPAHRALPDAERTAWLLLRARKEWARLDARGRERVRRALK